MKNCTACGKSLDARNQSGLCKVHHLERLNTDPTIRASQRAAVSAWAKANPEAIARRQAKTWAKRKADVAGMEAQAERMRTLCQPKSTTPEAIARRDRRERARAISRALLPWCPDQYRADYRDLVKNKGYTAAEARAITQDQMKRDRERAAKAPELSPFERQERALRNGAALQDNAPVTSWSPAANELRAKIA